MLKLIKLFSFLFFIVFLTSCLSNKQFVYFQNVRDSSFRMPNYGYSNKIQKGDILFIAVTSQDPKSSLIFSSANSIAVPGSTASGGTVIPTNGFLVEKDGTILFPKFGAIQAEGKTKEELRNLLVDSLTSYLKDPIVNIRFMNFRVTVLGEVVKPSTYFTTNDRLSILEALGQSGDLTPFGNRKNILLMRDSANVSIVKRLDISDNSLLKSPYFYLQSGDVIYVEPIKQKGATTSQSIILIPIVTTVVTSLLLILNYIKTK
jgi:polysaccharide export outer membrane protein